MTTSDQPDLAQNEGPQPLVSILIFNYDSNALKQCLDSIFGQSKMTNFEVVLCDDNTTDGSWVVANEYMRRYPGLVTLSKNQTVLGALQNMNKVIARLARGTYYVTLTNDRPFEPDYILQTLSRLESDPLLVHSYIGKTRAFKPLPIYDRPSPELLRTINPLVSNSGEGLS